MSGCKAVIASLGGAPTEQAKKPPHSKEIKQEKKVPKSARSGGLKQRSVGRSACWKRMYDKLVEFKQAFGHTDVSQTSGNDR